MNRKFLIMLTTICGLVMVASLLFFPLATWGEGDHSGSARAVQIEIGGFLLLLTWVAAGFAALAFFKKTHVIGMSEERHLAVSFLGFKLSAFFLLALLIAGAQTGSWGVGFWFAFIASIFGSFSVYLTFNPALAEKIAAAAKQDEKADDKPDESAS